MKEPSNDSSTLFESLSKLDKTQYKYFYCMLIHYRVSQNAFISRQNVFNLWCELNKLCHEVDEGFPDIYDHDVIKSYCHEHPYYFINILDLKSVTKLFCQHLDDKIDVLVAMVQKLYTEGIRAAYECVNKALDLDENIDILIAETEAHVREFS